MKRVVTFLVAASLPICPASAAECNMSHAFNQLDNGGKSVVAVGEDKSLSGLLFADRQAVHTDGTRRSYSVEDFWGKTHALNNLCNAMADGCDGLTDDQLAARRAVTQEAKLGGWPADLLAKTRISSSIIPMRDGKPCPEVGGYLVSATALHRRVVQDACDISNYADALLVPAIVLPQRGPKAPPTPFETRNAKIGDLAVLMRAGSDRVHYAVVGDLGPAKSLGEVSVALAGDLLGRTAAPANYDEIRGRGKYKGKGWVVPRTFALILPGTRRPNEPYMDRQEIERDAKSAFATWGGLGRLRACSGAYDVR